MNPALWDLLKQTSRSFGITLRILPHSIREQIGLAYLLARTTDTIADTEVLPVEQRLAALQQLRDRILGGSNAVHFQQIAQQQSAPAERALLEKVEEAILVLQQFSPDDLQRVRDVLKTIISGQELDLIRFQPAGGHSANIIALKNDAELDDYTYRVAGCVGEFWTRMCRAHLFPHASLDENQLFADGIRFGKGLQLVNILRDIPADLQKGRCYLPGNELISVGLSPQDLLSPKSEPAFRPIYNKHLNLAHLHLAAGWRYTNTLPRLQIRVRLACALPVLIGVSTLKRLRSSPILSGSRVKISRSEVRSIIIKSILLYPFKAAWKGQFPHSRTLKDVA